MCAICGLTEREMTKPASRSSGAERRPRIEPDDDYLGGGALGFGEVAPAVELAEDRHRGDAQALGERAHHVDDGLAEGDRARDQSSGHVVDEKAVHQGHERLDRAEHQRRHGEEKDGAGDRPAQDEVAALGRGLTQEIAQHVQAFPSSRASTLASSSASILFFSSG